MRVTFVGTGDAFGSGGRAHTCLRLDNGGKVLMIDFGAGSIIGWRRLGFSFNDIDGVLITHLHGDHFGGLPFLLLEAQFVDPRDKPLPIFGPPGLRSRLAMAMEAFFPGATGIKWRFPWEIREISPPSHETIAGFDVRTVEVVHASGAPATAVRVEAGGKAFAFSGDTAWTDALLDISADADLLVCECHSMTPKAPGHMDWPRLREKLPSVDARRVLITHMGPEVLASLDAIREESGLQAAYDGLVVDL
ncbi:MAG TPA: MBL fold metallo-hydrolase [Rhodoblastus sp.]|nr:MBL fold metallo-hydrolase [Rhodoblastus sp.]